MISNILSQDCWKSKKNHTKTLGFGTLDILQLKKIDVCENIYSVNPLYLLITHANGYIEENGVNKYLIFDSTNENKLLILVTYWVTKKIQ